MGGVAPMSEFKNHTPRVLQKVHGALGNTLFSFTNKTNSCLQINICSFKEIMHGATKSLGLNVGFGTSYDVFQHRDLEFHF
ncbi:unnamed protein product [Prunus armeniaca]